MFSFMDKEIVQWIDIKLVLIIEYLCAMQYTKCFTYNSIFNFYNYYVSTTITPIFQVGEMED